MIVSRAIAVALLAASASVHAAVPSPAALADVDKIFAEWQLAAHVPGLVYGVVVDGRLVHVRGLGVQDVETRSPVTPDTLFRIASMSKAFTALAILKLRDEGKVSLDAPAELYVPELRGWKGPTTDSPRITVRNLMRPLGMTATGYDVFASPQARRAIGYRWQDNGWQREPDMKDGAFGAMGGVETSANDYARWVAFLLSAWPARDGPDQGPVPRGTVRQIVTGSNFVIAAMRNAAAGGTPCRQARTYAMGWSVTDDCDLGTIVSHSGGYPGYGSNVLLLPSKGVGIFAFSSKTYGAASLPNLRAALSLAKNGALADRLIPTDAGLALAYDAARAVWRSGDIASAPLANNMLMDHDAAGWRKLVDGVKADVGSCAATEPVTPVSAMEGKFRWTCERGRVVGRVQRAPTPSITLQALEFAVDVP